MKLDDLQCCPACGGMFRPIRDEDICIRCIQRENEALAAIAHELEAEDEQE
jgi:hypothetical protein